MNRYKPDGFTLIEILVAMSLLAIIGILGWRGVDGLRQATTRLDASATRRQEVALATERIGRDIRRAIAVSGHAPDGSATSPLIARRLDDGIELIFTRLGEAGAGLQRIGYRWRGTAGVLDLQLWPARDTAVPGRIYPLLRGIARLDLLWLDGKGQWQPEWPGARRHALPRALLIRVALQDGGMFERIFDVPAAE